MRKTLLGVACALVLLIGYANCSGNTRAPLLAGPIDDGNLSVALPIVAPPMPAQPTCSLKTVYVDPSSKVHGDGSLATPFRTWSSVDLRAGGCYYQKSGTVAKMPQGWTISASGVGADAANPQWISIAPYGTGAPPQITGPITFDGASHVQMSGFKIVAPPATSAPEAQPPAPMPLVSIVASSSIQLIGNVLTGSTGDGISVGAGDVSLLIYQNQIVGSALSGIAIVDPSTLPASGQETLISANSISSSGCDGIEALAQSSILERNVVWGSGRLSGGCSGIHVAPGASGIVVRYNVSYLNHDALSSAGDGIWLDQGSLSSVVLTNLTFLNDGAGLRAVGANGANIQGLISIDDAQNAGSSRGAAQGEIVILQSAAMTFSANEAIANQAAAFAVYVDSASAAANPSFGGDWFLNAAQGGAAFSYAGQTGTNIFAWRSDSQTGATDAFDDPPFFTPPQNGYVPFFQFSSAGLTTPISLTIDGIAVSPQSFDLAGGLVVQ